MDIGDPIGESIIFDKQNICLPLLDQYQLIDYQSKIN